MSQVFKPQSHLINIICGTAKHHPNFSIFLGAGASATSNIKTASQLIYEWRQQYREMYDYANEDDQTCHLEAQHWHNSSNEYSILFEKLYDHPSQRRDFIESCLDNATPSWGYIYLVNLLKNKHFNTIFTTNFDDLVNESCYTFSANLKPLVCAHDSSILSVRLTADRPKIIKLHGDFLFDNIKNTVRELESLENNMRAKFKQFATEFGMIVIGYSGHDRSIMDTLDTLLHTDSNFPHGVYWCVRKGTNFENLSDELKDLSRFPKFNFIEIDGFDEFFAELHSALDCELQEEVSSPYKALVTKLTNIFTDDSLESDHIVDNITIGQKIIKNDYNKLMGSIKEVSNASEIYSNLRKIVDCLEIKNPEEIMSEFSKSLSSDQLSDISKIIQAVKNSANQALMPVPNILLAKQASQDKDYQAAIDYSFKSINESNRFTSIPIAIRSAIALKDKETIEKIIQTCAERLSSPQDFSAILGASVELIDSDEFDFAVTLLTKLRKIVSNPQDRAYLVLNLALAKILKQDALGSQLETELMNSFEWLYSSDEDERLKLGFAILCEAAQLVDSAEFIIRDTSIETLEDFMTADKLPIKRLLNNDNMTIIDEILNENPETLEDE